MSDKILYQDIEQKIASREEEDNYITIPKYISQNLKHTFREYQIKTVEHFIYYMEINRIYKNKSSKHLLFHMATGSGKTNIIASTILYLYQKGYRDFIFFVNTQNIITKTKENLVNPNSNKYLFDKNIIIDNRQININVIDDTFDSAKKDDINILFTTIHKLHSDLETTIKENSICYSDFEDKKIVLIADEAHHLNANTKTETEKKKEKDWESTTQNLLSQNKENILLEFTATSDMNNINIANKYKDKIIYNYPLVMFREDKYSKEIRLINSNMNTTQRMLQAIMISEYRQIIAQDRLNIHLKPVILFKNPTNVENSQKNFEQFKNMIESLTINDIDEIFRLSDIKSLNRLFEIIKSDKERFVKRLKYSFNENNLLLIHSKIKNKDELMQKYLNSLENNDNHIRAIFAVNILNEGWDVLNLFDIVKLDEAKTTGISTISEAQLIGRGARYCPFEYKDNFEVKDTYKRKFDDEPNNELKVLEEMNFYSINQSDYIEVLTQNLKKMGLYDISDEEYIELKLKKEFLESSLYNNGYIYENKQIKRDKKAEVFGIVFYTKNYKNDIVFFDKNSNEFLPFEDKINQEQNSKEYSVKINIIDDVDLIRIAINKKPFFYFNNLKKYFPNLKSISEFISSNQYLGDIKFNIKSNHKQVLNNSDKINLFLQKLTSLQNIIENQSKENIGTSTFEPKRLRKLINPTPKRIKKKSSDSIIDKQPNWYVFHKHTGTQEEYNFVEYINTVIYELEKRYDDIRLIRNEKAFKIYDISRNGDRFEPDFVLMLKSKKDSCYHQIFCEPKGDWTKDKYVGFDNSKEKWKEDFLKDITNLTQANKLILESVNDEDSLKLYENKCYRLFGLPFYNYENKDEFVQEFEELVLK